MARKARSLPKRLPLRRAVMVLHDRIERLERAIERRHRPLGFICEAHGDVVEVEDSDEETIPEET